MKSEFAFFVAQLLNEETMTDMCREFGISRKTGYAIFDRYKECRLEIKPMITHPILRTGHLV